MSLTMRRKSCEKVPTNEHTYQVGYHTIEVDGERPLGRKSEK